ncbi:MAG: type II toxin-antitoxin system prevent-host-death family antitoxin [Actinomycetota bacterium]|nr:type II toxin-antitoxin system prevent-host-death family antitoxin [Actinomycetota bacterium]
MEHVGIREMRQHLSRYAKRVRDGESFVIADRGEQIAQLGPPLNRASAVDRLVADRGAIRAKGDLLALVEDLPEPLPGPSSATILDELREDRV